MAKKDSQLLRYTIDQCADNKLEMKRQGKLLAKVTADNVLAREAEKLQPRRNSVTQITIVENPELQEPYCLDKSFVPPAIDVKSLLSFPAQHMMQQSHM